MAYRVISTWDDVPIIVAGFETTEAAGSFADHVCANARSGGSADVYDDTGFVAEGDPEDMAGLGQARVTTPAEDLAFVQAAAHTARCEAGEEKCH